MTQPRITLLAWRVHLQHSGHQPTLSPMLFPVEWLGLVFLSPVWDDNPLKTHVIFRARRQPWKLLLH